MEYKKHIFNSSVVLNTEWTCTINCPGCDFWVSERTQTNRLSIDELKKRIDFSLEKLKSGKNGSSLILLPWNVLLEYSENEILDILNYACSKTDMVQWEFEIIDEKILDILDYERIKDLLLNRSLYLNIWYKEWNYELLVNIFNKIRELWINRNKKLLKENNLLDSYRNLLKNDDKFNLLVKAREDWILPFRQESIPFSIHFIWDNILKKELYDFMINSCLYNVEEDFLDKLEKDGWDKQYDLIDMWLYVFLHSTMNQKIDKNWNNIWDVEHRKWYESCILLDSDFEWSIWWDKEWTILPHCNPCINKISFWNIQSSDSDIEDSFRDHKDKIKKVLIKNKYRKDFDQSELCRICLDWEEEEINFLDYLKYIVRQQVFITKENVKYIFRKK